MADLVKSLYPNPEAMKAEQPLIARQLFRGVMRYYGVTETEVNSLCDQLCITFNICTSENVQQCKSLIIKYIICNQNQQVAITAFFKYLTDMATAYYPLPEDFALLEPMDDKYEQYRGLGRTPTGETMQRGFSSMQRMHIIYVVHDVLATVRGWIRDRSNAPSNLHLSACISAVKDIKQHVTPLVEFVACRNLYAADNAERQLNDLIAKWEKMAFFTKEELATIRDVAKNSKDMTHRQMVDKYHAENERKVAERGAAQKNEAATSATENQKKDYSLDDLQLPKRHGVKDVPEAPWHMLPAGNGLYMKRTRGYPLKAAAFPKGGYELPNGGKEASPDLKKDVDHMYKEVLHCFDEFTPADSVADIDVMGNKIWKDPERDQRNYWGFTEEGLKKAKENKKKDRAAATGYADVPPLPRQEPLAAMNDINAAVARAQELAAGRGFGGGGGRGRGGGGWRGGRGGSRGGGFRGGRGRGFY